MTFKDATSVIATITAGDDVDRIRGENRTIVSNLGNGKKPLSDADAARWNLQVNVNWGEGPSLFAQALRQFTNAFQRPPRFFKVGVESMPAEKRNEWEMCITNRINKTMKDSLEYFYVIQEQNASVVSHGVGPEMWEDKERWKPRFIPMRNLRVATDTEVSFRNLEWFAVRTPYTEGELAEKVWSDESDPGWNKKAISEILESYHDKNYELGESWVNNPEKMAQLVKQNGCMYQSDAVPTIPLWHFFFKDRKDKNDKWLLRIVPDVNGGCTGYAGTDFLFESENPWANKLCEILHCQFGDLNTDAPFMYQAVRSMGSLLVEPCYWTNLARCRTLQYLMESFNTWFRIADPTGKARATEIQLFDKAVIPEGVSIVPAEQRHRVDGNLIETVMAQLKQLQGEATASYTQSTDTGTSREQTAYETSVKVAQVNAMMSGMLLVAFVQKKFAYMEICRRFCISNSKDEDVQAFQKYMEEKGVPHKFLNVDLWDITPEVPLGAGNPTMEQSQANQLMGLRAMLDPEAQRKVLHTTVGAITQNSYTANDLVPIGDKQMATDGQKWSASIFGTLMQGIPIAQNMNVSAIEQIENLMGMMAGVIARIESTGNMATKGELAGLVAVSQYVGMLINQLMDDQSNAPRAKQYAQQMGKLTNVLKGFAQRLKEQDAQKSDPEAQAKTQATMMAAQLKMEIDKQAAAQRMALDQQAFQADQQRKDAEMQMEERRANASMQMENQRANVQLGAEIQRDKKRSKAEIANEIAMMEPGMSREQVKARAVKEFESQ